MVQVLPLPGDAPLIPIRHQLRVLAFGYDEIPTVWWMVIGADIHVAFAAILEQSLLERLDAPVEALLAKVVLYDKPRLRVSTSDAVLEEKVKNQPFWAARWILCDLLLDGLEEWHNFFVPGSFGFNLLLRTWEVHRLRLSARNAVKSGLHPIEHERYRNVNQSQVVQSFHQHG